MQVASQARRSVVGLGEFQTSAADGDQLVSLGLGSCVALCLYDPVARVAGMAHMVLPSAEQSGRRAPSARFVDHAIPALVGDMVARGAVTSRFIAKLAGGAQMLNGSNGPGQIGERNVASARDVLQKLGIAVAAMDTGGTRGRTVRLDPGTGAVTVAFVGSAEREL